MDYTPALQPLFDSLWYLIPLIIIAAVIKSPWFKAQTEQRLSNVEVQKMIEAIESGRLAVTFRNQRKHVAHVKEVVVKKNSEPRCPKCQGEMVKRTVKRGENIEKEFFGCKAFPKCRGMVGASLLQ